LKQGYKVALLILLVLLIDQALKFYVKTHYSYNEDHLILGQQWARLHFVENEGMAFGITFDWAYGKLVLSLFRILMVAGLIWYIRLLMQAKAPFGFICSVGLITAGAMGNIIDSAIYGLIFSESSFHNTVPANLVAFGEGYGTFLHGKVVDMLYFPIKYFEMPDWAGGGNFLFFSPIFNIADASITTGVLAILFFQRSFFRTEIQGKDEEATDFESVNAETADLEETPAAEIAAPEETNELPQASEEHPGKKSDEL
jgi:signal peptidase II